MYYLFGISLALTFFFAFQFSFSLLASGLWRIIAKLIENESAQKRAGIIFAFRVAPSAFAFLFVFVFLIPGYLLFESYSSKEVFTFKLVLPTLAAFFGIALAFYRFVGAWLATRRLVKNWLRDAEEIKISNISIPVYRINHRFPVIAVVGAFRPQMFVAGQVFDLLDDAEMQAAIWHECGHLAAHDNLKSIIFRVCRDLLVLAPFNRRLERAWTETTESAADEYAATRGDSQTAINLAGALVKIARIIPRGTKPAMPAGAFLIEQQTADVTCRVRRLLQPMENKFTFNESHRLNLRVSFWIYLTGFCGTVLLMATNREFLHKIHLAYETVVVVLQ